jgi:hypothetical protein
MRPIGSLACLLCLMMLAAPISAEELKSEGTIPGFSIVIQDLKRDQANSVTLRFQMINNSDKPVGLGGKFKDPASKGGGNDIGGVHLIDNVNKKKYLAVRDTAGKCACAEIKNLGKGEKASLWAKFAAPPDNVDKITVVVPDFQPVDNVPITR